MKNYSQAKLITHLNYSFWKAGTFVVLPMITPTDRGSLLLHCWERYEGMVYTQELLTAHSPLTTPAIPTLTEFVESFNVGYHTDLRPSEVMTMGVFS